MFEYLGNIFWFLDFTAPVSGPGINSKFSLSTNLNETFFKSIFEIVLPTKILQWSVNLFLSLSFYFYNASKILMNAVEQIFIFVKSNFSFFHFVTLRINF